MSFSLEKHMRLSEWRNVRPVTSYICPKCNAGFRRAWDLIRHKCGQTPRYACPYCHKKDNSSSNVYRHIRRWHPNHPVGARQNAAAARKRRKVYSLNKSHYCPRCNRGFTLKKNMTRHLRHECGMAPKYQCPYCDKLSKFTQNIYAHIRKYHPDQALCFRRLRSFSISGAARRRQYASPSKRFVCKRCNRRYVRDKGLRRHQMYECGKSPRFKCPYCGSRAKRRSTIYVHVRMKHPGMHVWTVDLGKEIRLASTCAFTALYSRSCYADVASTVTTGHRRRFRTRLGASMGGTSSPGTYECPKCRKIYKWYRGLHRHLEYECGKTPRFKCPHCVYIGKHRSHVYSHIKSNHYNRPIYAIDLQQD
ncbi:Krueppel-related zinc finger protein 1-like [Temnothorax curvispinosus]|uniref:Krueppel-related zinc finger protein 1-like n=1 Tax=Temnothorax curvispinosus TaxID=300111 RepID=A0A6J1R4F5_9HYME|nr:Krueppel-related zinc finger protein 1-like [Temnothorax curvispinosus]